MSRIHVDFDMRWSTGSVPGWTDEQPEITGPKPALVSVVVAVSSTEVCLIFCWWASFSGRTMDTFLTNDQFTLDVIILFGYV